MRTFLFMDINSHQTRQHSAIKIVWKKQGKETTSHSIDLRLVCIKLAQFNAFCWWKARQRRKLQTHNQPCNQLTAATIRYFNARDYIKGRVSFILSIAGHVLGAVLAIEVFGSNCNNACLEHLPRFASVWCYALCFWHVKFYHIWHNSIFCILLYHAKREWVGDGGKEEQERVYHGRMLLEDVEANEFGTKNFPRSSLAFFPLSLSLSLLNCDTIRWREKLFQV